MSHSQVLERGTQFIHAQITHTQAYHSLLDEEGLGFSGCAYALRTCAPGRGSPNSNPTPYGLTDFEDHSWEVCDCVRAVPLSDHQVSE